MSNNLDTEKFNKLISELDNEIGIDSDAHKDTLMAISLIMLRGKDIRMMVRNRKISDRYYYTKQYILNKCPYAQMDLLNWHLFREGIISEIYLIYINNALVRISFIFCTLINIYLLWFKFGDVIDVKFPIFLIGIILSLGIAFIVSSLVDAWKNSCRSSYFGLGYRKK